MWQRTLYSVTILYDVKTLYMASVLYCVRKSRSVTVLCCVSMIVLCYVIVSDCVVLCNSVFRATVQFNVVVCRLLSDIYWCGCSVMLEYYVAW